MLTQQWHAQIVDRNLFGEFECARDDILRVERATFTSRALRRGSLLRHLDPLPRSHDFGAGVVRGLSRRAGHEASVVRYFAETVTVDVTTGYSVESSTAAP